MYKYVYIWLNNNTNIYYMKLLNHYNSNYFVGYTNIYNHTIVYIDKIVIDKRYRTLNYIKVKSIRKLITFLENIL